MTSLANLKDKFGMCGICKREFDWCFEDLLANSAKKVYWIRNPIRMSRNNSFLSWNLSSGHQSFHPTFFVKNMLQEAYELERRSL